MAYLTNRASALIKRHGTSATILKYNGFTVDKRGVSTENPRTAHPCFAVIVNTRFLSKIFETIRIDDANITILLSVEGLTFEPTLSEKIRIGSIDLPIRNISRHAPNGEILFYEIEVKKW